MRGRMPVCKSAAAITQALYVHWDAFVSSSKAHVVWYMLILDALKYLACASCPQRLLLWGCPSAWASFKVERLSSVPLDMAAPTCRVLYSFRECHRYAKDGHTTLPVKCPHLHTRSALQHRCCMRQHQLEDHSNKSDCYAL